MATNDTVTVGRFVTWHELPLDRTYRFRIVKPEHMRPEDRRKNMPANAPIAKALLGKRSGDRATVETPAGVKTLTVREVR